MLIFHRRSGQSFTVGEAIITVHIVNGQIKVAADAPKHIPILRDDAIARQRPSRPIGEIVRRAIKGLGIIS